MIYPTYHGKPVIPSRTVFNELIKAGITLNDTVRILECGFDCARSKRKEGTIERCVRKGKKTLKVVAVESYNYFLKAECWLLIYVGIF